MLLILFVLLVAAQCDSNEPTADESTPLPDSQGMLHDSLRADTIPASGDALFPTNAVASLCDYSGSVRMSDSVTNQLLLRAEGLSAQVTWWEERKEYALVVSVDGTYDCQLTLFTQADLGKYVGQTVTFSGKVLPYVGKLPDSPIGGVEFFRVVELSIAG